MINLNVSFTTGTNYIAVGNPNDKLITVLNNLFQKEKINPKIMNCLGGGSKLDMNKTLSQNNLTNGSLVILQVDTTTPMGNNDNNNNNLKNSTIIKLITSKLLLDAIALMKQGLDFLVRGCGVPQNIFDSRGHCTGWNIGRKSGPPGFLKNYSPPLDYIGIGLKCFDLYDGGNNAWIGDKNQYGEWYIAYHSIKSVEALIGILKNGFRKGAYQKCQDLKNINPLTVNSFPTCQEGVYFIPDFNEAKSWAETFKYHDKYYEVILMCRINPYKVRIAQVTDDLESWIVNGDALNDPNAKKYDDEVRINRILLHIHDNN
jgi:hypothetical protein